MHRHVTSGRVTAAQPQGSGVIDLPNDDLPGRSLVLGMAFEAEMVARRRQQPAMDRAMRRMADGASLAQSLVFEHERPVLLSMTGAARGVLARHGQTAGRFQNLRPVRIMAGHAVDPALHKRMMAGQPELRRGMDMTLETGFGLTVRVDNPLRRTCGRVAAARTMTRFAAGDRRPVRATAVAPSVGARGKPAALFGVTIGAGRAAHVCGPCDVKRSHHASVEVRAGYGQQPREQPGGRRRSPHPTMAQASPAQPECDLGEELGGDLHARLGRFDSLRQSCQVMQRAEVQCANRPPLQSHPTGPIPALEDAADHLARGLDKERPEVLGGVRARGHGRLERASIGDGMSSSDSSRPASRTRLTSVAFSPDAQRVVTGSQDQTAKVWDAGTGRELLTLEGHTGHLRGVAFSPDGQRVATGIAGANATVKVWSAVPAPQMAASTPIITTNRNWISGAFSSGQKQIVTATRRGSIVEVLDPRTGRVLEQFKGSVDPSSLALSPDALVLAFTSDLPAHSKTWRTSAAASSVAKRLGLQ